MDEIEVPIDTETPRAVSAVVRRGDRYLLVLRANPPAQDMYAFPGGRIDPGETAEKAVLRELEEETGIVATSPRPYATYDLTPERSADEDHYRLTVFTVSEPGTVEAHALDDAAAVGWYDFEETRRLDMPVSMHHCLEKLARDGR